MATITQDDIIALINNTVGNYPYTIQFFQRRQRDTVYPSIEVVKVSSDSTNIDVQKTQLDQTFEIKVYIKYVRREEDEENDRLLVENEVRTLLETANLEPPNKIFLEEKNWTHHVIDNEVFGSISTLRLTVRDITSTTGEGIVGSGDSIELNSEATPTTIQILGISKREGATVDTHMVDDGNVIYDPRDLREGEYSITYESTTTLDTLIKGISDSRVENNGKIIRGGVSTNYSFLLGNTIKSGQYGTVEKSTTEFFVTGVWV